jgi:hypothetical protein
MEKLAKKSLISIIALFLLITQGVLPVSAAIKSGSACKTLNQKNESSGKIYTCIKSGNKLVWDKGVPASNGTATNGSGDEIESLPLDATKPLNVDLKGQGQGKGLTFVPFGFDSGSRGQGAIGSGTKNPQPVFYAPIGTPVLAPITGVIIKVTKLYSSDYNIMMANSSNSKNIWEVEHVIDVSVKEGDKIKAGQGIAKVGDFDERYTPGIGLVELGMMISSNGPPTHYCPFAKIKASVKSKMLSDLAAIVAADTKRGFSAGPVVQPGCTNLSPIEG